MPGLGIDGGALEFSDPQIVRIFPPVGCQESDAASKACSRHADGFFHDPILNRFTWLSVFKVDANSLQKRIEILRPEYTIIALERHGSNASDTNRPPRAAQILLEA